VLKNTHYQTLGEIRKLHFSNAGDSWEGTIVFPDLKRRADFPRFSNAPGKLATSPFSYMQTIAPYPRVAGPAIALEHGNCGNPFATRCSILVGVTFSCCGADIHDRPNTK